VGTERIMRIRFKAMITGLAYHLLHQSKAVYFLRFLTFLSIKLANSRKVKQNLKISAAYPAFASIEWIPAFAGMSKRDLLPYFTVVKNGVFFRF